VPTFADRGVFLGSGGYFVGRTKTIQGLLLGGFSRKSNFLVAAIRGMLFSEVSKDQKE
jgi:hypothetical protein